MVSGRYLKSADKRGGPSPYAGATGKIIEHAGTNQMLPLQVMLDNMKYYCRQAEEAELNLLLRNCCAVEGDDSSQSMFDDVNHIIELRRLAGDEAARAALYVHLRMGRMAGDHTDDEEFIPLAERLAYYARRDDLKSADGKAADVEPPSSR